MKIHSRLGKNLFLFGLVAVLATAILFGFQSMNQSATVSASALDFNPGRIIDDSVFYNKDAMSLNQIQNFLDTLIPWCNTWNSQSFRDAGGNWVSAPYVCINNYHENPTTGETSFERGGGAFSGGHSAARIIYDASQKYGINPQVLLVMLKKESLGPITSDNWPTKWQYRYAMGYACPDSGPGNSANCDASQAGFYKQVNLAAWQFKYYKDNSNSYRYKLGWNDIQYSPDPSCGTKRVYIENLATLSLYIYTPYVPNDAALANYPGTAHCGAYGNRNFFMFFREWFGSVRGGRFINIIKATTDINNLAQQQSGILGSNTTPISPEYQTDGRVWQNFQNGTIVWTESTGANYIVHGPIYDRWRSIGGSTGLLGIPTRSPETGNDGRIWQEFTKGTMVYSSSTGAWEMLQGPINDAWRNSGGSLGTLGKPTSNVIVNSNGTRQQTFEKGIIIRKNITSPAYIVQGRIYDIWKDNVDKLGTPTTNPVEESDDNRTWQNFEKGTIIQARQSTPRIVEYNEIYSVWRGLGGSVGQLGKPTSNQTKEDDGRIWQSFEKGLIVQKNSSTSPREVLFGSIYDRWRSIGGSLSELGTPKTSSHLESDGRSWQDFENGTIISHSDSGTWEVLGGFYAYWRRNGGSLGSLGKPTGERIIEENNRRYQNFENGRAIWLPEDRWIIEWN